MNFKYIFSLTFGLILSFGLSYSQNNTKSFYSSKGFGEREFLGNNFCRSLGHVSNGVRSDNMISFGNPASVSSVKNVYFDFGFRADIGSVRSGELKNQYYNGNLNYFSLAFPILKKDTSQYNKNQNKSKSILVDKKVIWAAHIGIIPFSNIGNTYYKKIDTSYGTYFNLYNQVGGLNNIYIQNAVNLSNNISLGVTTGYLFGLSQQNFVTYMQDSFRSRLIDDQRSDYRKGFNYQVGFQGNNVLKWKTYYNDTSGTKLIKKVNQLRFVYGGTFGNIGNLNSSYSRLVTSSNQLGNTIKDTLLNKENESRILRLTPIYSFGFSATLNNLWMLIVDYSSETLNNYNVRNFPNDSFTTFKQFSVGFAYRPDVNVENMKRIPGKKIVPNFEYRFGLRMANTGLNVLNNRAEIVPIKEIGISFGLGIPKPIQTFYNKSMKSMFNISYEYIMRGTPQNGLVADNIHRFTLSFNLNDIWFVKRKIY